MSRFLPLLFMPAFLFTSCQPQGKLLATWPGSEDLSIESHAGRNRLFTGTVQRRKHLHKKEDKGRIEMLDLDQPGAAFRTVWERSVEPERDHDGFIPVGLEVIRDPAKQDSHQTLLYVANAGLKGSGGGKVSIFEIGKDRLMLKWETPRSLLLPTINGITVARDGTIYASNFNQNPFIPDRPKVGAPASGSKEAGNTVVCFRPKSAGGDDVWKVVASGIAGANGMALTPDERHLLVCSYHARKIHSFSRDPISGDLLELGPPARTRLGFHPDNLKAAGNHEFTVAGQRNTILAGLQLLVGLRFASGGGERFHWEPGKEGRQLRDFTPWLKTDRHSPSTVIQVGGSIYSGHIVSPGVRVIELPRS